MLVDKRSRHEVIPHLPGDAGYEVEPALTFGRTGRDRPERSENRGETRSLLGGAPSAEMGSTIEFDDLTRIRVLHSLGRIGSRVGVQHQRLRAGRSVSPC